MTDNDKAATFLGWDPESGKPAPDMYDPGNYMTTLDAVCRIYHMDVAFGHEEKGHFCDIGDDNAKIQPIYSGYGVNWGEAATNALAKFYDANAKQSPPEGATP